MRDCVMREISFLCAWWRKKPFIVIVGAPIVVAWKRKKSVHDCVKLEKMISLHDCMNVNKKVPACVIGHPPPLPGGPQRPFGPITYIVFYVYGLCFIKSCFLLGKSEGKSLYVPNFPGWKNRRTFGIFGLHIHFLVFKILQSKCSVGSTAILQQHYSLQWKTQV